MPTALRFWWGLSSIADADVPKSRVCSVSLLFNATGSTLQITETNAVLVPLNEGSSSLVSSDSRNLSAESVRIEHCSARERWAVAT